MTKAPLAKLWLLDDTIIDHQKASLTKFSSVRFWYNIYILIKDLFLDYVRASVIYSSTLFASPCQFQSCSARIDVTGLVGL